MFGATSPGVALLSDDMPMGEWQKARSQQMAGDALAGGEGDDVLAGGAAADRLARASAVPVYDVDRAFLQEKEGLMTGMYVPTYEKGSNAGKVVGQSGATIGKGVDLGQQDAAYLRSLKLDPGLVARLSPYLGMKGDAALAFVRSHPLQISASEADALSQAVFDEKLGSLAAKYDAASQVGPFHKLPRGAQTAITSLYFQYGTADPARRTPNYWRQITTGDWDGAYANLMDFKDQYRDRRRAEAALLKAEAQSGKLPRQAQARPGG